MDRRSPLVSLGIIALLGAFSGVFLGRVHTDADPAALARNPEQVREVASSAVAIAWQRDIVANVLLNGVPLTWQESLVPAPEGASPRVLWDGLDDRGVARIHGIFDARDGRLRSVSLIGDAGSSEGRMSVEAAGSVARAWLNRLREIQTGPWRPLGRGILINQRGTVYTYWASPGCVAFVGVCRETGMPCLLNFRYGAVTRLPAAVSAAPAGRKPEQGAAPRVRVAGPRTIGAGNGGAG